MHTPTKQQWQTVIDNLKKALPMATLPGHLDMMQNKVNSEGYECGTVHCFAGWYAISKNLHVDKRITYGAGCIEIANDLGFSDDEDGFGEDVLKEWAMLNPEIWGNYYGHGMFCDEDAFNNAQSLSDIIVHLEGVRDRSPE